MSEVSSPHDVRNFSTFVASLEDGSLHSELTDALRDLVATLSDEARDRGGKPKGKISLSIELKLDSGVIEANTEFKVAKPKSVRSKTIFWATPENNLTRSNPKQQELPLRDVTSAGAGLVQAV